MDNETGSLYEFGPFQLDATKRLMTRNGVVVPLTSKVFDTLLLLIENRGHLVSKDEFMRSLWPDSFVEEANLPQNISALRKALGESPDEHRYILTVPGQGYRFVGNVRELTPDGGELILERLTRSRLTIQAAESDDRDIHSRVGAETGIMPAEGSLRLPAAGQARPSRKGALLLGTVAIVLLAAAGLKLLQVHRAQQTANTLAVRSLAVLPFTPLAGGDDEYLGVGLADALITRLTAIRQIIVRPTTAVLKYSGSPPEPGAAGRALGVDSVLEGRIQRSGARIRLTVELIRVSDGRPLWAQNFDDEFTNVFVVEDSISERVAAALAVKLGQDEQKQLSRHGTENIEAYQDYLRGRFYAFRFTADGFRESVQYFDEAIERDPVYALAYAGLADSYLAASEWILPPREAIPKARAAALKAVSLDNTLGEAHASLAHADLHSWDFPGARKEFARSLDLNPRNATTHLLYAEYLIIAGQLEGALAELATAREIDPLGLEINGYSSWTLYLARRYDEAIAVCKKGVEMDPNFWMPHYGLGDTLEEKGRYAEALVELERADALDHNPMIVAELGHAYAASGQPQKALAELGELGKMSDARYVAPYYLALVDVALGRQEQALEFLREAVEDRSEMVLFLPLEPKFDSLRKDRRFQELLRAAASPLPAMAGLP